MDLVFLYGPPAVGKLTVAQALASRTGLKLFHNHYVVDAVTAVFDFRSAAAQRLRERMWLMVFEEAAASGVSLIFTFVPERTLRTEFVGEVVEAVEGAGGRVRFVELSCPIDEQERRIDSPSRARFAKLRDVEGMRALRADGWLDYPMPPAELTVDTGALNPAEAAQRIAQALALPRAGA